MLATERVAIRGVSVGSASFAVSTFDAPDEVAAGATFPVTVTVTNPNDPAATQAVTFRFGGVVLASEDGPYTVDGSAVTDAANATLAVTRPTPTPGDGTGARGADATATPTPG